MTKNLNTAAKSGRQSDQVAEQSKKAIMQAALSEFAKHGFEGASLRNIAKHAGTTHGLIRHHFGSKDEVFKSVVDYAVTAYESGNAQVIDLIQQGKHLKDPINLCKMSIRNFARVSAENPDMMRLLMHEGASKSERLDYLYERIATMDELYSKLFEEVQAVGALSQLSRNTYFLFLICNLGLPFGLTEISNHYVEGDILNPEHANAHTERMLKTLFPE